MEAERKEKLDELVEGLINEHYFTETQVCLILGIGDVTLSQRRSTGTNHPPYIKVSKHRYLYPKDLFFNWMRSKKIWEEVKSVS